MCGQSLFQVDRTRVIISELILIVFAFLILSELHVHANDSDVLKRRFLEEAPPIWEDYKAFADRLQGTVTSLSVLDNNEHNSASHLEIMQNNHCSFFSLQTKARRGPTYQLRVSNPKYTFLLERKADDVPWTINRLDIFENEGTSQSLKNETISYIYTYTHPLIRLRDAELPDLVRSPTFRITKMTNVDRGGGQMIEIEFDNQHPFEKSSNYCPVQGGTIDVDPDRCWTINAAKIRTLQANGESRVDIECKSVLSSSRKPIPIMTSNRFESVTDGQAHIYISRREYSLRASDKLPDDTEFQPDCFWSAGTGRCEMG